MVLRNVFVLVGLALLAACGPGDVPLASENAPLAGEAPALRLAFAGPEDTLDLGTSTPVLDFGQVRVGTQSARVLELRNLGSTPVKLESLALSGGQAFTLRALPVLPYTLEPRASVKLEVGFAPLVEEALVQTLKITSNDPATPSLTVTLQGQGVSPKLVVEPSVVDFGDVRVGQLAQRAFTVQNHGTGPITLTSIVLQGPPSLTLSAPPAAVTLAPGMSIELRVSFTPDEERLVDARLSLRSTDPAFAVLEIPVRGRGVKSNLVATATSVDFGTVALGESSIQQVLLRNVGSADAVLAWLLFEGAPDFSLSGMNFPLIVPPGGLVQLPLKYHPARSGPSTGTVTFMTTESATPGLTLGLKGQGGGGTGTDPALVWTPSAIDFGAQRKGTTATRLLTVSNEGTAPRIITGVALDAHAYPVFTATTLPLLPFFLAPGSSVQFQVTFNPVSTGAFASALTLTTTDPLNPFTSVPLTGMGTGSAFGAD